MLTRTGLTLVHSLRAASTTLSQAARARLTVVILATDAGANAGKLSSLVTSSQEFAAADLEKVGKLMKDKRADSKEKTDSHGREVGLRLRCP